MKKILFILFHAIITSIILFFLFGSYLYFLLILVPFGLIPFIKGGKANV